MPLHQHLYQTHQQAQFKRVSVTQLVAQTCDYESPEHAHQAGQLVMALAGGVRCVIDGQVWMVPPQGAVWIPPSHTHSTEVTHNAQVLMAFILPNSMLDEVPAGTLAVGALLRELLLRLVSLQAASDSNGEVAYQNQLIDLLLWELKRAKPQAFAIPVLRHERLQWFYQTLLQQPNHPDGSAAWAKQLAISERSLLRWVKQDTGLSFARWRQQVQLLHAVWQLAAGQSVQQVAMDLGYESVSAFITVFKKRLGTTPKRYGATQPSKSVL